MNRATKATIAASLLTITGAAIAGFGLNTSGAAVETRALTTAQTQQLEAQTYSVDRVHSSMLFKIRHAGLSHFYGRLNDFEGSVTIDPDDIENASFEFTVHTNSVDTNNASRDGHIKNADFFNARQYPKATFKSNYVKEVADGVYDLRGDFSFHGETKTINATLTDLSWGEQQGKPAVGFHAVFRINRSDFGITKYVDTKNPESGPLGDKVEITVSIEAVNG